MESSDRKVEESKRFKRIFICLKVHSQKIFDCLENTCTNFKYYKTESLQRDDIKLYQKKMC